MPNEREIDAAIAELLSDNDERFVAARAERDQLRDEWQRLVIEGRTIRERIAANDERIATLNHQERYVIRSDAAAATHIRRQRADCIEERAALTGALEDNAHESETAKAAFDAADNAVIDAEYGALFAHLEEFAVNTDASLMTRLQTEGLQLLRELDRRSGIVQAVERRRHELNGRPMPRHAETIDELGRRHPGLLHRLSVLRALAEHGHILGAMPPDHVERDERPAPPPGSAAARLAGMR